MDDERLDIPDAGPPLEAAARRPSRVTFRAALAWALGLIATLSLAAFAAATGLVLSVFGLGGVALAAVALLALIGATVWRRGMLPLAVIALGLALPAAWAASGTEPLERSRGELHVLPRSPSDVGGKTFRRGVGAVLVDLRKFNAPVGSTTRIAAQADAGRLVVALPRDRCFHLDVRFEVEPLSDPAEAALTAGRTFTRGQGGNFGSYSALGLTSLASQADSLRAERAALRAGEGKVLPYDLLAFNRNATEAGRYRRAAIGQPSAPTLRLDLRSSQQIVIRDYPPNVGPLLDDQAMRGYSQQVAGMLWPQGVEAPFAPVEKSWAGRSVVRTPTNRARWIRWEREIVAWAKKQARRAAGPCASTDDLRARGFTFLTQPEAVRRNGRTERLLGPRNRPHSAILQPAVDTADTMLQVEVNGLGETRMVGLQPGAGKGEVLVMARQLP